jgi:hypothetical protein
MKDSYKRRPHDFKRRILKVILTDRADLIKEEYRILNLIKKDEFGTKYYNFVNNAGVTRGNAGKQHSVETKLKISTTKKLNPTRYWQGKTRSKETNDKISKTKTGTIQSEEHKLKNSNRIKELWADPIWRQNMINARRKSI